MNHSTTDTYGETVKYYTYEETVGMHGGEYLLLQHISRNYNPYTAIASKATNEYILTHSDHVHHTLLILRTIPSLRTACKGSLYGIANELTRSLAIVHTPYITLIGE